jgi:hypothetical protein
MMPCDILWIFLNFVFMVHELHVFLNVVLRHELMFENNSKCFCQITMWNWNVTDKVSKRGRDTEDEPPPPYAALYPSWHHVFCLRHCWHLYFCPVWCNLLSQRLFRSGIRYCVMLTPCTATDDVKPVGKKSLIPDSCSTHRCELQCTNLGQCDDFHILV